MSADDHEGILLDVAERAAKRYLRRCWWADIEDLTQEAMVACLTARRTWNPLVGVPLQAYAWRAAMLHLRSYVWRRSSPVSASDHFLDQLRGVHHTELDDAFVDGKPWVEHVLADEQWKERVRQQLAFLLAEGQGETTARLALDVLLGDDKPGQVAQTWDVPAQTAYRAVNKAKELIRSNQMLYDLLKEKDDDLPDDSDPED